ncbi:MULTISPECIES: TMEM175 family protein [unclassified Kribbella]|uniref:TMEM175 family protein n=1 Tax=unclassified Kribbella TaxID=2644121 RepID=UPI0033E3B550
MATQPDLADTSRIEAFSDGVFAIAITLLVIELHPPELDPGEGLWPALLHEWPQFAAYLTSFAVIGIMWVNHHSMFRQIQRADRELMFLNLLLLLWTALLPFPTNLFAEHLLDDSANANVAAAVYSTNLTLAAIAFSLIWWHVLRKHLVDHNLSPAQQRRSVLRFSVGTLFYALTIGLSFVSAPLTLLVQFLLALYYGFEQVRADRTPSTTPFTESD